MESILEGWPFDESLLDVIRREAAPEPWSEGEKIPWDEPGFSRRMLQEHLSQEHDAASRRIQRIASHVEWIHREVLAEVPTGPQQEEVADQVARETAGPRLYSAFALSVATVVIGAYYKLLPGLKSY